MSLTITPLPLTISEAAFQETVIATAMLHRWRVCHFRPALTARGYRTPFTGHPGWVDLALARDGELILAELKRHGGRPTPDQRLWLAALGRHGRLWTPGMWPEIAAELRDGPPAH